MDYCIVTGGIIENMIVCEDDETAAAFGALPGYDGARIGDDYAPPPPPETWTETQALGQQVTGEQLERIAMGQAYTDLELAILQGGTSHV